MEIGYVVETKQGTFLCERDDAYIGPSLRDHGGYGIRELQHISQYIDSNSKVLWIGTHIGALLVPVAKVAKTIIGIEANPKTFKLLEINIRINNLENVKVYNVAAGESNSKIDFVLNTHNSGGSKRKPTTWKDMYYYDNPQTVQVPLKKIDDLLPDRDFNVLFMDIEGSEYFALQGMPEILKNINVLIMEFFPFLINDVSGATVNEFHKFLKKYKTVIAPNLGKYATLDAIFPLLNWMYDNGHCEEGLIFLADEMDPNIL